MEDTTLNKEQVYDQQISPLLDQIIAICQQRGIAMVASFALPIPDNTGLRCSTVLPDETGRNPSDHSMMVQIMMRTSDLSEQPQISQGATLQ
ncbi:hypothetical protein D3C87_1470530 [compost metagenome]